MPNPYGATFDEFLNDPDRRAAHRARGGEGESMHDRAAREHAEIMGLAEAIAPDIAREKGISVDDARKELVSGVRYPEPAITNFYHQTIGRVLGSPPQEGEPALARIAELQGKGYARASEADRQKAAMGRFGALSKDVMPYLKDPSSVGPALSQEFEAAGGAKLGDLRMAPAAPAHEWESFDPDPATSARKFEEMKGSLRHVGGGSERNLQFESLVAAYRQQGMKPDEAVIAATHDLHGGKGKRGKSRAEYELDRLKGDIRASTTGPPHEAWRAEWNAALAEVENEQRGGRGGGGRPSLRDVGPTGATPEASVDNPDDYIDRALGGPGLGQEYLR